MLWASMLGWGSLVHAALPQSGRKAPDAGLRGVWGMAAMLALGGPAAALHIASRPFLLFQTACGLVLLAWHHVRTRERLPSLRLWRAMAAQISPYLVVSLALVLAGVEYLGQLGSNWTNASDDQPLYYFLPQKLIETGSILDPFDVRRMTTYGGQIYLHALFLSGPGRHFQLNVVDAGIGTLLVLALVIGAIARRGLRRAGPGALAVVLLIVLTIEQVRFNIGSLMTGLAALLGVVRTLHWIDEEPASPPGKLQLKDIALLAVLTGTACTLRTSNALPIGLFMSSALVVRTSRRRLPAPRFFRESAEALLAYAAFGALFLLPWFILFDQSCGTLIYPLSHGNMTPDFAILKVEPGIDYNAKHIIRDLLNEKPFATSILFYAACFAPPPASWRGRDYSASLAIVTLLGMAVISYMGGAFDETANSRYYFAFLMCLVIVCAITAMPLDGGMRLTSYSIRSFMVVGALAAHMVVSREELKKRCMVNVESIDRATTNVVDEVRADTYLTQDYQDVQGHVPEGAPIVVAVHDPFRFNMKRNPVYSLDLIGGMGPPPGFPAFQGPEALASYLLANGIRYIIHSDFEKPHDLYDLSRWRRHMTLEHSFLNYEAPFMVDGMANIERLDVMHGVTYRNFDMRVIDLSGAPASDSEDAEGRR
jgi:hypothetical protein